MPNSVTYLNWTLIFDRYLVRLLNMDTKKMCLIPLLILIGHLYLTGIWLGYLIWILKRHVL